MATKYPILYDKFNFTCHPCHIKLNAILSSNLMKGGSNKKMNNKNNIAVAC